MRNWAGNQAFHSRRFFEPQSVEELAEIVRRSVSIRALGTRHSFNQLADTTGDHVSLARLEVPIRLDPEAGTVTVGGGQRYGELCHVPRIGRVCACQPRLPAAYLGRRLVRDRQPRIGCSESNLAAAAAALEIVRADGEIERIDRATPADALHGAVVSLGALGVVSSVTLDVEPTFRMRQVVYEDLALSELVDHFEEIVSAAYSVSLFTDWSGPSFHQVWLKARLDAADGPRRRPGAVRGAARGSGPAPDPRLPGRGLHAPDGSPGSVARAASALPARPHAERRR